VNERDPLKWKIAVSLAALVVLGGGLAILQKGASVNESNSARETTRVAVRAMSAHVAVATLLGVKSELDGEREFLSFQDPLTTRPRERAAAQRALPGTRDPEAVARLRLDAERAALKQQALTATRIAWNDRSTQYTTVIAVLAAALFLVGFGLVVEGSLRRVSYLTGLAVAAFAAGWAVWIHQLPIPSTPDAALDAAARGAVLTGDGHYEAARAAYGRAIAIDGDYAAAFTGRSRAGLLAANPDYQRSRAYTDADGRASAAAARDAERALALDGRRDLMSFALVAIQAFYRGDYEKTVEATDDALAINPRVPDLRLLRGAARVALGQPAEDASVAKVLDPLSAAGASRRVRLLASSSLSYLAWVAWSEPPRAPAANRLAGRVVRSETALTLGRSPTGSRAATGTVRVGGLRFADGRLRLVLRWHDLPVSTALSAVGYERPLTRGAWAQPAELALFADVAGTGSRRISIPLDRACKPGRVRVDVFLDGAQALSRTGPGAPRGDRCG